MKLKRTSQQEKDTKNVRINRIIVKATQNHEPAEHFAPNNDQQNNLYLKLDKINEELKGFQKHQLEEVRKL